MSPNVPIQLLIEAQQHVVTVELTSGELYRGRLLASEDNMNVKMSDVVVTARDGKVTHMDLVYVRGSHVKLFILPDILRYSPILRPETLDTVRVHMEKSNANRK